MTEADHRSRQALAREAHEREQAERQDPDRLAELAAAGDRHAIRECAQRAAGALRFGPERTSWLVLQWAIGALEGVARGEDPRAAFGWARAGRGRPNDFGTREQRYQLALEVAKVQRDPSSLRDELEPFVLGELHSESYRKLAQLGFRVPPQGQQSDKPPQQTYETALAKHLGRAAVAQLLRQLEPYTVTIKEGEVLAPAAAMSLATAIAIVAQLRQVSARKVEEAVEEFGINQ